MLAFSRRTLLFRFGLDVALWGCVPAAFLFFAVSRHLLPQAAVMPHLRLVLVALLGLALCRIALAMTLANSKASFAAASVIGSALLAVMIAYYAVVLLGLESWGRVISWDLLKSYAVQVPQLAEVLGISLPIAVGAVAVLYAGLFFAVWLYLRKCDWTPSVLALPGWLRVYILLAGISVCAIELYRFIAGPEPEKAEPVTLTIFPKLGALDIQGYRLDRLSASRLDAREDEARIAYRPASRSERRNVILIVVDALRPDHMGIYGYARDTTPYLSGLERGGRTRKVANVRAACGSSACGLLSISSSKFVHQFSFRPMTLHEVLRRHGYRVHMIFSGDHISFYRLNHLYGTVDSYFDGYGAKKYPNDDQMLLERLTEFPAWDGIPVLMQFHLMSAHVLGKRGKTPPVYLPAANYGYVNNRDSASHGGRGTRQINYYDNGVLQADAVIHELLGTLQRKGYLKNAVVAITADHGESLGEHGLFQHANSVREQLLRVPLVLVAYGYRPSRPLRDRVLASHVDIAPTLLAELGMPKPATWSGVALQEAATREFVYFQERTEVGLLDGSDTGDLWKYWVNAKTGEQYAFDLTRDPDETTNALAKVPMERRRQWRLHALPGSSIPFERVD